ncbi:MAG: class I SAM-dependent methyltransferase family protein [Methanosarcinaceae archaeon]|nr:class I SAM-dependent methyltransferase family protein [Methanosarcinaceae archaeon]
MNLRDQMSGTIPAPLLHLTPKRFDIIGNIAVISIPPELDDFKDEIAKTIVSKRGNVRTVLNKVAKLDGEKRVGGFERLLGSDTVTQHREFGFEYRLDLNKVFFNSRLGFERKRVTAQVLPSENVIIPFCGVGPFVVPAAASGAKITAIEKNTEACKWLAENVRLNGVGSNVSIINADASEIVNIPYINFDRAIVPTPYGLDSYLASILPLVKKEGMVHFYTFKVESQIQGLIDEYESMGLETVFYRRCGNVAPSVSRWVFDLLKR